MIKAVVIDDEPAMQQVNKTYLAKHFKEIEVVGCAGSIGNAIDLIKETKPDLVLLDIELKDGTGFQVLEKLRPYNFKLVFITGFNDYAIKAIKFSALDYILKPVDEPEFQIAIQRAIEQINNDTNSQLQSNVLLDSFNKENQHKKLVLRTNDSMHILNISEIIYCKSDNSYTTFYTSDGEHIMVSKSIKEYDELLCEYGFLRPHQSYLVNLNYVKKIDKTDGGFIILKNKKEIPVSIRQKKSIIKSLDRL